MNRVVKIILAPLVRQLERVQQKFRRSRPGSVLIMVVALLVLLALMGTAYLATARQDRLAAGLIQDNGLDTAVKQAANDALASALNWLSGDPQTFTTTAINNTNVNSTPTFSGPLLASRMPEVFSSSGLTDGPPTLGASPAPTGDPNIIRWPRITTPQGYGQFASPIPSLNAANSAYNGGTGNNYNLVDPTRFYDFGPAPTQTNPAIGLTWTAQPGVQFWPIPSSITITYPATGYQGSSDLAGKTFTYPAFMKANFDYATGKYEETGPYLAADAAGDGIADCGLVQLNVPSVNGVTFFAGWRIVDNAAALNLNTAWGPNPYQNVNGDPGGTLSKSNVDPSGNAFNFFPTDIDIYGFLRAIYNQNDTNGQSEMPTLQFHRAASQAGGDYSSSTFADGANNPRDDMQYLYRGQSMWMNLGRRLNSPFNLTGDPADGMRRPFDDADTIALGNRGVLCDPNSPGSKIEQIFAGLKNNASDSIYRDAVNYMTLPQDRFTVFPANSIAYWYDWCYNVGMPSPRLPTPTAGRVPTALGFIAHGTGVGDQTDTLYLGKNDPNTALGYGAVGAVGAGAVKSMFPFRTPRAYLVGSNPVANVARYVDDAPAAAPQSGLPAIVITAAPETAPTNAAPLPELTGIAKLTTAHDKVSLNTADFPVLWRSFVNVFNDFNPEDGSTTTVGTNGAFTLQLMRDALGYEIHDPNGQNPAPLYPPDKTKPYANPRQLRNVMRDPGKFDSFSWTDSTTGLTTSHANGVASAAAAGGPANNNPPAQYPAYWLDSRNMLTLRAALAAVNVMTLRDQHGHMFPAPGALATPTYFAPDVYKQIIPLMVTQNATTQVQAKAIIYGAAAQPYITEVYMSTDTSQHQTQQATVGQNPKGLIVIKLYNPYPFDLPISPPATAAPVSGPVTGYDIAYVNRSQFSTGAMTMQLISRTDPAKSIFTQNSPNFTGNIPANGYIILTNFDPSNGYWPQYQAPGWPAAAPTTAATNIVFIPGLSDALVGPPVAAPNGTPNPSGELVLLRPLAADSNNAILPANHYYTGLVGTTAEVPVDSFDFSGVTIDSTGQATVFYNWHYLRQSGNANDGVGPDNKTVAWRCVYPGSYSGSGNSWDTTPAHAPKPPPAPASAGGGPPTSSKTTPAPDPTYTGPLPHFDYVDVAQWDTSQTQTDPWDVSVPKSGGYTNNTAPDWHVEPTKGVSITSTFNNSYPGIQICNIDFGGANKRDPTAKAVFPYGGFARVGDVQQVPFIGSYIIVPIAFDTDKNWPLSPPGAAGQNATSCTVMEVNPVTIDSAYCDDGDQADDTFEQLGRFVPLVDPNYTPNITPGTLAKINDFWPSGYYAPGKIGSAAVAEKNNGFSPYQDLPQAAWRYHFAQEVFNQFTTIANPGSDYFPNMHPSAWYPASTVAGNPDGPPTLIPSNGNAVEGLINVNTADWRTLASVEMIPRKIDTDGSLNAQLAKAIVYYRDVSDGQIHYMSQIDTSIPAKPKNVGWTANTDGTFTSTGGTKQYSRGHGPFNSLAELNNVFDPSAPARGFQNGMGTLATGSLTSTATRRQWGYYIPGKDIFTAAATDDASLQNGDWLEQNLMVERVSNLLTTRSDSFTVYIIVQGWRNAFQTPSDFTKAWPELVVQKRLAVTVDRSALTSANKTVKTTAFPTK